MQPYITISGVSLNLGWTLNKMVGFQHARRTSPMLQYCMSLHISEESKRMVRKHGYYIIYYLYFCRNNKYHPF